MGYIRRKYEDIRSQIMNDIVSKHRKGSVLYTIQTIWATICSILATFMYGAESAIEYFSRQLFIETADDEYLEYTGKRVIGAMNIGVKAVGLVSITSADNVTLDNGYILTYGNLNYKLTSNVTIQANKSVQVNMVAENIGKIYNRHTGDRLTCLNSSVTEIRVVKDITNGTDKETPAQYRKRYANTAKSLQVTIGRIGDYRNQAIQTNPAVLTFAQEVKLGDSVLGEYILGIANITLGVHIPIDDSVYQAVITELAKWQPVSNSSLIIKRVVPVGYLNETTTPFTINVKLADLTQQSLTADAVEVLKNQVLLWVDKYCKISSLLPYNKLVELENAIITDLQSVARVSFDNLNTSWFDNGTGMELFNKKELLNYGSLSRLGNNIDFPSNYNEVEVRRMAYILKTSIKINYITS